MKIKLKEHGIINIRWIDEEIKRLEEKRDSLAGTNLYSFYDGRACQLENIKKQLIPSEKIAGMSWEDGHYEGKDFINNEISDKAKQHFLTSEIELL